MTTICLFDALQKPINDNFDLTGSAFNNYPPGSGDRLHVGKESSYVYVLGNANNTDLHDQLFDAGGNNIKIWETGPDGNNNLGIFGAGGQPGMIFHPNCFTFDENSPGLIWQGNFSGEIWWVRKDDCGLVSSGNPTPTCRVYYEGNWTNWHSQNVGYVLTVRLGGGYPEEWHRYSSNYGKIGYYHATPGSDWPYAGAEWYNKVSRISKTIKTCTRGNVTI